MIHKLGNASAVGNQEYKYVISGCFSIK